MTMIDCCDTAWILSRIAAKKALIEQIETAIASIATGAQSYQLNTGQTQQLVTKGNVASLRLTLKDLESDIVTLQARLGCGRFNVRPGW
jgi:hypothetical protein